METMRPVHILDMREDAAYQSGSAGSRSFVDLGGARTTVRVPLVKDGTLLGAIAIYRQEVNAFTDKQIALLESFAAQAVIAMENARLLGELRERTEELARRNSAFAERIDHQAATIEVLKEMSDSPSDAQPVFDLICRQAKALLGAPVVALFEYDGNLVHLRVNPGIEDVVDRGLYATYQNAFPMVPDRGSLSCRAIVDGTILHIRDLGTEPGISEMVRALGHKTQVTIPLMRDGHAIGAISAASMKVDAISDTQIELLKTIAEQAVIAIGSAETYRALQERTAALAQRNSEFGERIEQQAATIDVLKVMSSTPDDTQPVFDQIVLRARELCNVPSAALFQFDGELVHYRARALPDGVNSDEFVLYHKLFPMAPDPGSLTCRAILEKRVIHVRNAETEPGISAAVRGVIRRTGLLSQLSVPMLRDGLALGAITLNSSNTSGFTDSQIALLQTFAEQAVIAIGSVSTFRALRERTAELTRSVAELQALEEVLRAVNSSLDLDTVLETIISRAVTLSQADEGTIYEYDDNDEVFVLKATHGMTETRVARLREARIKLGDTYLGRAGLRREPVHVSDLQLDPTMPDITKEALHDIHAVLAVPLLRDDKVLGGLVIRRRTTGDFQATIPNLLQTFAAQSVLAIENARLFQDARRARLAAEATLTDLRRTQDRLVQTEKMASLGQLTAGIAHEIKNPLNFVNNFSDLSVDLLNELNEAVAPDRLAVADDLRAEIDEITATLKGNLERIAQHGRRADSIVKNMLLHSRTGPSEHREIDLNATVEEALNLAYHGARAEMPGFNITLERHFDPAAGVIDAFPQEFTRVMLNLMSNGFYAARKRLATAPQGFEPTLTVTTTNLGEWVKIQVRDNGTGMPDTVRDKIFEPFFTTKPAGEGTGLGLSLSFDIVVKQHGGQLTVDSAVDTFTEFNVTLPRRVAAGAG
jgi:GAF domain-containing protein